MTPTPTKATDLETRYSRCWWRWRHLNKAKKKKKKKKKKKTVR